MDNSNFDLRKFEFRDIGKINLFTRTLRTFLGTSALLVPVRLKKSVNRSLKKQLLSFFLIDKKNAKAQSEILITIGKAIGFTDSASLKILAYHKNRYNSYKNLTFFIYWILSILLFLMIVGIFSLSPKIFSPDLNIRSLTTILLFLLSILLEFRVAN